MSDETAKDEVLTSEEIEALVERAREPGFDDGEFRAHDFSGGQSLSMSKWTDFRLLLDKHAEALKGVLSSEYGVQISVNVNTIEFGAAGELLMEFPERLCLISTPTEPFDSDLHLLLPGELLTSLVNYYFGGGSLPAPTMPSRVTPSEQRIGERISRTFFRAMSEIWSDRLPLAFGDLFVDITPDRFSMLPKALGLAVIPFELAVGDNENYLVRLLVPFDSLEAHEESFIPRTAVEPSATSYSAWEPEIRAALPEVAVEIRGELCELKATLRTLLQMQVGTTIPINEPNEVELFVDADSIAVGRYGAFDGFKAMQFSRFREDKS
jgi:flagellar motor switch protein FliM